MSLTIVCSECKAVVEDRQTHASWHVLNRAALNLVGSLGQIVDAINKRTELLENRLSKLENGEYPHDQHRTLHW